MSDAWNKLNYPTKPPVQDDVLVQVTDYHGYNVREGRAGSFYWKWTGNVDSDIAAYRLVDRQ